MDKIKKQPGHPVKETHSVVRHVHPWRGPFPTQKKKEVGHKNKTNTCTDQMMFCICTVQIMHCLPAFEHHANDHLSQKVSVILAAPAPRAQLQPSCSPCAVQLRKDHLLIVPIFTPDLRLKRHYQTGGD